jgi:hypothetical protein
MTANQLTQPNQQQQQATVMQQRAVSGQQQAPTLIFKNANNSGLMSTPVSVSKANSQVSCVVM